MPALHRYNVHLAVLLLSVCSTAIAFGQDKAETKIDFAKQILPILSNKCFVCHGPDEHPETDLRLDSVEGATADRGGYFAVDTKDPPSSAILERIHSEDDPMPPEDQAKQLTDNEKSLIDQWIRQGGHYAAHWAFRRPEKSKLADGKQGNEAIDAFVERQLTKNKIGFAKPADRSIIARRVAFVLTGLPPEPNQLQRFLADQSESAYEKLVDELMASPRFGEHQARYWLDAVRYGDTHGLHLDNRRGIYPYRDWVVKAFNENLPYDEFVTWQLAGDLLPDPSLEQLTATGYVRMNPSTSEGGAIPAEFQAKNNFDRTETFGTVFLGLSMTCARCHTHKYDPITQTEYYRLLAFFNSTAEKAMDGNSYTYGNHIRVPENQQAWSEWNELEAAQAKLLDQGNQLANKLDESLKQKWENANPKQRLKMLADPNSPFGKSEGNVFSKVVSTAIQKAEASFTTTLVAKELPKPRETKILERGEYNLPTGEPLSPGVLSVVGELPEGAPANRLGLARWLTSRDNPLTSRVLVNQIWQRVFGAGLVRTPEDFGVQGQQPTHPDLLDWLAVEFQENGWDHKAMIRMMVLSKTFRQSSAWRTDVDDPANQNFSRGPGYRLDAEVLRDVGLWASKLLDPTMGGEGVKPYQPPGMWKAMSHPASNTKDYVRDTGQRLYRRSLYVYWKRTSPHPMMTLFDAPSRESSCMRREATNTSLQSLALLNETQRVEMARALAERLMTEAKKDEKRLEHLFSLLACRPPNEVEKKACLGLLATMKEKFSKDKPAADQLLATGEAARNKKLDLVEHAAWTQLSSTVLASDVAILLY